MIRTNDAAAAMRFMVAARRLGLEPVAHGGPDVWELETVRDAELGAALWSVLLASDPLHDRMYTALELQEYVDERNRFSDTEERLERQALVHLDAAAAAREGMTLSDAERLAWQAKWGVVGEQVEPWA